MSKKIKEKQQYGIFFTLSKCAQIVWRFDRGYAIYQLSLGVYGALFAYFTVHMLGYFLDLIISKSIESLNSPLFAIFFGSYIALALFNRILASYKMNIEQDFGRRFSASLNDMLVIKRSELELSQLDSPSINDISLKANDNIGKIDTYLGVVTGLLDQIFSIITALIITLPYSVIMTVLNIAFAIPEYFVSKKVQRERYSQYDKNVIPRRHFSNYRGFLSGTKVMREVKLWSISIYLIAVSRSIMDTINIAAKNIDDRRFKMRVWVSISGVLAYGSSLLFVYNDLVTSLITIGASTILVSQFGALRSGFNMGFFKLNELESQSLYLQDVFKFLDIQPNLPEGALSLPNKVLSISMKDAFFSYPESDKVVLGDINIDIPRGSKVAIVGENGAGKSTLTKLLLRYYDPTKGSVLVNGIPLYEFNRAEWYQRISYMPQDYNKYPFKLREVITLGENPEQFSQERYDRALTISQVDDLIKSLKHGDQSVLSPQFQEGVELSVGQAQKVAIARVLYRQAEILILDEPTSAIDAISELHIFNQIENLPDDITVFLISHRFNTVKNADIIIVLEHGTIVESGRHEDLLANRSRYYEMYTAQKDSFE